MKVLSLGAGVQSSTVLLMSCQGVLPKLDAAIFADTQWEPSAVYAYLSFLEMEAQKAGIPVYRVSKGNIRDDALHSKVRGMTEEWQRWVSIPFYKLADGQSDEGQIRRQCTKEYKIEPITRKVRELANAAGVKRVELWYGISGDELRRMRISKLRWIENYYPLVFGLDRPYHRHDCLRWIVEQQYPVPPRSACLGCPYHSDAEWAAIKKDPVAWADVTQFDAAIRDCGGLRGQTYLHRSCKPLPMVDFESMEEKGQRNWLNECEGMCGV